jgi:hypothetical protein
MKQEQITNTEFELSERIKLELRLTYLLDIKRMRLNIFVWALYRMGAIEIEIFFVSCLSSINLNRKWKKYWN